MIAIFVALTATFVLDRIRMATSDQLRWPWLAGGAVALGAGIWGINFMAMLAVAPMSVLHADAVPLLASMAVIAGSCTVTYALLGRSEPRAWHFLAAGLVLGLGIIGQHGLNMVGFSMQYTAGHSMPSGLVASASLLLLSLVAAPLLGRSAGQNGGVTPALRLLFAVGIGVVLTAMQILAWSSEPMTSVKVPPHPGFHVHADQITPIAAVVITLLNGVALIAAMMEHRVRTTSDNAAQRLRMILDSLPIGIAYVDAELRFNFVNRMFTDIYHPDDTDIIGQTIFDVGHKEAVAKALPYYHRALTGERCEFLTTVDLGREDATGRQVTLVPEQSPRGAVIGVFIVVRDVSEQMRSEQMLRESEQRLAALLKHVPAAVFLKDQDARYKLVNRQYEEWFGIGNEQAAGKTVHELFPPERAQRYWQGDVEILSTGQVTSDELKIPTTGGEWRTFILTKFPIADDVGNRGYGGIMLDVTKRAAAEQALRQSERRAALANRAKSEFLANMSHELRTPLNAIIGFSEILRDQMLGPLGNERYSEYAVDIHDSADHLLGLINDILDLSKIESGTDELLEEDINIDSVVESVITLVKGRAIDGQVSIIADIAPNLPDVCADKRKLKQILVNLLTNAVKFTEPGGSVTIRARWQPGEDLLMQVIDTGIGMASDDIPLAMSPFGQVDSSFSRRFEGTGLGLPLANQLMKQHRGSLDIDSSVGEGTTVTLRLPADRVVGATIEPRAAQAAS